MSKLNRREFKALLTEWNSNLDINLLLEISQREVIDIIGKDDYDTLVKLNKKASQDQNFLKVIINTYKAGQSHSIEDIEGLYQNYTRFIAQSWNQGQEAFIDVPGGLRTSLIPDTTTYDTMLEFIDASLSMDLKTKAYVECLKQGPVNLDFEVIINDDEWIICYPKTIKGSISLARSFWNGSELEYDATVKGGVGRYIGNMSWCTSIVSGGNMFLNYHRAQNLHMYYCIKKNTHVKDIDRKLCISFKKEDNEVRLVETNASVDANNSLATEEQFRSYIGTRFDVLCKDVEKPERLEIDEKAYYESISLEQYKLLRAANEENLEDFINEFSSIIRLSKDKEKIKSYSLNDDSERICSVLISYINNKEETLFLFNKWKDSRIIKRALLYDKNLPLEIIKILLNDESYNIRETASEHPTNLKHDLSTNDLSYLREKSVWYKKALLNNEELLSPEVLEVLASDENPSISSIAIYMSRRRPNFSAEMQLENKLIKDYIRLFLS